MGAFATGASGSLVSGRPAPPGARPPAAGRRRACARSPRGRRAAWPARTPRRSRGAGAAAVAFCDHDRRGQRDSTPIERDAEVDQCDQAEVAQHPDVRQRRARRSPRSRLCPTQRPQRRSGGRCAAAPRRVVPARRSWRWRSESSTLNSVETAITSGPSVTDIGFKRNTDDEQDQRRPAGRKHHRRERRQHAAPAVLPEGEREHERDHGYRRRAGSRGAAMGPPPSTPDAAASTVSPTMSARTPAGGCSSARIRCDELLLLALRPGRRRRTPKESAATRRSGVITSWEKYGGIVLSRPSTSAAVRAAAPRRPWRGR